MLLCAVCLSVAPAAFAQPAKQPIGRFVVDVRGTSAGLPTDPGWTPLVPTDTEVPSRGFGLDFGAHVYVLRFKRAALGLGASWDVARGRTSPPETTSTSTAPAVVLAPAVTTRATTIAPQVSLNFGHSLGWSYLSAGLGRTRVKSEADATGSVLQPVPRDSDWIKTINYGGGARWFINDHVGVGFDLRWYQLSIVEASATSPGAPRASLLTAAVGMSLK
jgi:opacity protein-like surface antigen